MKNVSLFAITAIVVCFCTACERTIHKQGMVNTDAYLDVMRQYFPYEINEHFVFENEQTKERKECDAYNYNNRYGEIYPIIEEFASAIDSTDSYGDWSINVKAPMLAGDNPQALEYTPGHITFFISGSTYQSWCFVSQRVVLRLSKDEHFVGSVEGRHVDTTEVFSFFTDTITIPLTKRQVEHSSELLPEGAYVHIVRNVGITDFSLNGESVWRRIEK